MAHEVSHHHESHNHETHYHDPAMYGPSQRISRRLILCFDGTACEFNGNSLDSNVVKLYQKFDRNSPHQMHYYQPGIGTYPADGARINVGWWSRLKRTVSEGLDQAFGTTFDSHVVAGYRFVMQYYQPGDRIYIFGFSRGAFTARFLARMIAQIGLLSMGNDQLVPFAFSTYQSYEIALNTAEGQSRDMDELKQAEQRASEQGLPSPVLNDVEKKLVYIHNFKETFCRHDNYGAVAKDEDDSHLPIKVHFLGLFETVNSISTFNVPFTKQMHPPLGADTAEHIRHAVAVDERRIEFQAALLQQEVEDDASDPGDDGMSKNDIKEVWFAGQHGDIGGGWPALRNMRSHRGTTFWQRLSVLLFGILSVPPAINEYAGTLPQLSDIPLKWMIDEIDKLPGDQVQWNEHKAHFMQHFEKQTEFAVTSEVHDTLIYGTGTPLLQTLVWQLGEYLPIFKRWQLFAAGKWRYITLPLNMGRPRDIPVNAVFHASVVERLAIAARLRYAPRNSAWFTDGPSGKLKDSLRLCDVDGSAKTTAHPQFVVKDRGNRRSDDTYVLAVEA